MKRPFLAAAAAATLVAATMAATVQAEARRGYGGYYGDGIIGGLSANAIVGGYHGYETGYPVTYAAPSYPPPGCVFRRQRVWNGYAWNSRKIRVCY